jgi:hypothetical protein
MKLIGRKEELGACLRAYLVATTMLPLLLLCSPNIYAADERLSFDIPAMEFPKAMLEYVHQSHWLTLYTVPDPLQYLKTKPILGKYTPAEALALMLKGTPAVFEFGEDGYFSVWGPADWYPYPHRPPALASVDQDPKGTQSSWTTATAARND